MAHVPANLVPMGDDEAAGAWVVRLLAANGLMAWPRAASRWLGTGQPAGAFAPLSLDRPWERPACRLDSIAALTGRDPEDVLLRCVTEAQLLPLMTEVEQACLLLAALGLLPRPLVPRRILTREPWQVKVCTECARRDLEEVGFVRVHAWAQTHLAGACPEHGLRLVKVGRLELWSAPDTLAWGASPDEAARSAVLRLLAGSSCSIEEVAPEPSKAVRKRALSQRLDVAREGLPPGRPVPRPRPVDEGACADAAERSELSVTSVGQVLTECRDGDGAPVFLPSRALELGGPWPGLGAPTLRILQWIAPMADPSIEVLSLSGPSHARCRCTASGEEFQATVADIASGRALRRADLGDAGNTPATPARTAPRRPARKKAPRERVAH